MNFKFAAVEHRELLLATMQADCGITINPSLLGDRFINRGRLQAISPPRCMMIAGAFCQKNSAASRR